VLTVLSSGYFLLLKTKGKKNLKLRQEQILPHCVNSAIKFACRYSDDLVSSSRAVQNSVSLSYLQKEVMKICVPKAGQPLLQFLAKEPEYCNNPTIF